MTEKDEYEDDYTQVRLDFNMIPLGNTGFEVIITEDSGFMADAAKLTHTALGWLF